MVKKYLVFGLSLILLLSLMVNAETVTKGQEIIKENKNITIRNIGPSSIIVIVDGVSDIISLGKTEEINGARITVNQIFYVDEDELREVDLTIELTYYCGDNTCQEEESKETCCLDCGCNAGYECDDNHCRLITKPECSKDIDCNDNNPDTDDRCVKNKCQNLRNYICKKDIECDDFNECTKDECINEDCFNTPIEGCKVENETIEKEVVNESVPTENKTIEFKEEELVKEGFFSKIINLIKKLFRR